MLTLYEAFSDLMLLLSSFVIVSEPPVASLLSLLSPFTCRAFRWALRGGESYSLTPSLSLFHSFTEVSNNYFSIDSALKRAKSHNNIMAVCTPLADPFVCVLAATALLYHMLQQ